MITANAFRGKRLAVYGLARSGNAAIAALVASGASVVAWDDNAAVRDGCPVALLDLHSAALDGLDALIVSPGVPLRSHPITQRAAAARVPIIGDVELFARARAELPRHRVVGITGTNGKSTTTALIHHLLQHAGIAARLGGNIGLPILAQQPLAAGGVYVLELSSYQLDLTFSLDCDVAVLLNLTPDHLDRHGDMAQYAAAKARLFAMQSAEHTAVIATDDSYTRAIATAAVGHLVEVSARDIGAEQQLWSNLQGPHNAQNVAAAVATVRSLGLEDAQIAAGLASYPGLAHRMQIVREIAGVRYVNDSKATNPTSAAPALAAFPRVHWIAGGVAKTPDLDACLPFLDHVVAAYLIGEAAPQFGQILSPLVTVMHCGELVTATRTAAAAAASGDTVLLSPACASFDQFSDFEARGRAFVDIVERL